MSSSLIKYCHWKNTLNLVTGNRNVPYLTNRKFLKMVCDVPEPEERFNIDEYSEMVILNKPVIYISIGELINTHKVWLFINKKKMYSLFFLVHF